MAVCVRPLPRRLRPSERATPPPVRPRMSSRPSYDETEEERVETARRQLELRLPSFMVGRTVLRPRSRAMWETPLSRPAPRVRFPTPLSPPPSSTVPSPAPPPTPRADVVSQEALTPTPTWHEDALLYARSVAPLGTGAPASPPSEAEGILGLPKPSLVTQPSMMPPRPGSPPYPLMPPISPIVRERRGTSLKKSFHKKLSSSLNVGGDSMANVMRRSAKESTCHSWSAAWGVAPTDHSRRSSIVSTGSPPPPTKTPSTGVEGFPGGISPIGPFLQAPFPLMAEQEPSAEVGGVPVQQDSRPSMGVAWGWGVSQRSLLRRTSTWLRPRPPQKKCPRRFLTHSVYDGEWHNLLRTFDGHGRMRLPNKVEYEGAFMDGMCHGDGTLVYPNGAAIVATWNRGRIVEMSYRAPNEMLYDPEGGYCKMPDRRFNREVVLGLLPACHSLLTDDAPPARSVPPGCYDAGDGIYDPAINVVYDPATITVVRVPTVREREWIIANCRKGWDENVGYRPDLFEDWVDGPDWITEVPKDEVEQLAVEGFSPGGTPGGAQPSDLRTGGRSGDESLSPSPARSEHSETSLMAAAAAAEARDAAAAAAREPTAASRTEAQAMLEPTREEEEPPERLLQRLEDRFLQEDYPPAFTEDVILRAPPPRHVDEMLWPEPEPDIVSTDEEEGQEGEVGVDKRLAAAKKDLEKMKKPMTERERKLAMKAQRLREEMTEDEKRAELEREAAARELRRLERQRVRRLREARTSPWPTVAKLMMPVLEESLQEREERRRLIEESMARELLRQRERDEALAAAKELAEAARVERERAAAAAKEEKEAQERLQRKEEAGEEEGEEGAEPGEPRLSLDEERPARPEDEYAGPWRHVAKRLVPHLRERIEDDRQAAAARWQEDLLQLLSERASTAGLEMSTSGYLGATAPPPEDRTRSSSLRIFPPGLEERARRRRAEREAREAEEAKELAEQGSGTTSPSISSLASGGSGRPDAHAKRSVALPPGGESTGKKSMQEKLSSTSRRVSISTARQSSPPEDEVETNQGSSAGPVPTLKSSKTSTGSSKK